MNQTEWQQAKEEFGEQAYKRFETNTAGKWWANFESNEQLLRLIGLPKSKVRYKSTQELFAHDVDVYGDNAYLMWECNWSLDDESWIDANSNDDLSNRYANSKRRKQSAALPFDLERARKGDIIKYQMMPEKTFRFVSMYDEEHVLINNGVQPVNDITHISLLYHPYPPKQPA